MRFTVDLNYHGGKVVSKAEKECKKHLNPPELISDGSKWKIIKSNNL